jgi:phosphopantothenoylcysteine decarboxylase/phosphopantothenate--cysteine ligase
MISVETTEQMREAVISELKSRKYDVVVAVAAAADWTPEKPYAYKVSTHKFNLLDLKLKPTNKIIDEVKKVSPKTFLLAFRAEYDLPEKELIESAYKILLSSKADLIAANDVAKEGVGFGTDTNEVFIVDKEKSVIHVQLVPKREVARKILDAVSERIGPK